MKRQRQLRSSLVSTTPSWLLLSAALTIPTLLHAFAPPNVAVRNKRSIQHQSTHDLQVMIQPSSSLISTPLPFLASTSATTSRSKLFARGPGRPSAASLEDDDDDDLDFEDEEDDEEVEGKL